MTEKGGIPDHKMIRSPEAENKYRFSKTVRGVNLELTKVHRNQARIVIVVVAHEGKKVYLVGTVYDSTINSPIVTAKSTQDMCFCPFARLLDMEEWKQVLTDSGDRLRYCTPIKDMLWDSYRICSVASERPFFRLCTVEGKWGEKPVDLIAAYSGSIYSHVGAYVPFALILDENEAGKIYVQGRKDVKALRDEFEADKDAKSATESVLNKLDDTPPPPPDYDFEQSRKARGETMIQVPELPKKEEKGKGDGRVV